MAKTREPDPLPAKAENNATPLTQAKRFAWWWVVAVAAIISVAVFDPQQLGVIRFKVSLLSIGLLMSYWADRVLYQNGPMIHTNMPTDAVSAGRIVARAFIVLAVILGLTLGL